MERAWQWCQGLHFFCGLCWREFFFLLGGGIHSANGVYPSLYQSKPEVLVVAGSLTLADGTAANVAQFNFDNSTWSAVGGNIPGPVTALSVNDLNSSSIFAAGQ